MLAVVIPQSIERFLSHWQGDTESIGYAFAYSPTVDIVVCFMAVRTGTGSTVSVEEKNDKAMAALNRFHGVHGYEILPAHSHPMQGLSPTDKAQAHELAQAGVHNILVVEPDRVASYNTSIDGVISPNAVMVVPDATVFEKYKKEILHIGDIIAP